MTTRIAFLSTAHIHTDAFIQRILSDELDARVEAIWDDDVERGQRYAEKSGARFAADIDAVLADESVDAVAICDANTRHLPLLEEAVPAGKPIFCEKPLATTVAEALRVKALLDEHGTPFCCGYFTPFSSKHQTVKAAVASGVFGKITHGFCRNSHHAAYGRWFDSEDLRWFTDPSLSGGGALMDMGSHAVHLLLHLLGPVSDVTATISNSSGVYPEVDDYGSIQMRFASGALGRAEASWIQHSSNSELELWGTEAALVFIENRAHVVKQGGEPVALAEAPARPDRMDRLVALARGDLSAEELADDLSASLNEVAVMEAAYRAHGSGERMLVVPV
ncbi:Gfo/Idh/MocA family protein [Mucisphaera sp.]|uniref:Gfo/Idh/MocA family protein n=1 Tax=Mucisphaera sp. TaxID=2913024 RepID=UPI003D0CFB4C